MAKKNDLVCVVDLSVNGAAFERGDVIGEVKGGELVPKHELVTPGNLAARLRIGKIQQGPLEVEEVVVQVPGGTVLPEGFPGKAELEAGGFATVEAVSAATDAELDAVPGLGPATIGEIREALQPAGDGTALGDDFPGKSALEAAGFKTIEAVSAATDEQLLAVKGVGAPTVRKIREALKPSE